MLTRRTLSGSCAGPWRPSRRRRCSWLHPAREHGRAMSDACAGNVRRGTHENDDAAVLDQCSAQREQLLLARAVVRPCRWRTLKSERRQGSQAKHSPSSLTAESRLNLASVAGSTGVPSLGSSHARRSTSSSSASVLVFCGSLRTRRAEKAKRPSAPAHGPPPRPRPRTGSPAACRGTAGCPAGRARGARAARRGRCARRRRRRSRCAPPARSRRGRAPGGASSSPRPSGRRFRPVSVECRCRVR